MAYIANMPDGQLPAWLSADRLMLWTLRALRELGGRAHLDRLYKRLGELLRIPEDLLWLEHPPGARQEDYVIRHRMRFALTDLGFLELVNSHGQGHWSLSDKGADFLAPLDEEDAPMVMIQLPFLTQWLLWTAEARAMAIAVPRGSVNFDRIRRIACDQIPLGLPPPPTSTLTWSEGSRLVGQTRV